MFRVILIISLLHLSYGMPAEMDDAALTAKMVEDLNQCAKATNSKIDIKEELEKKLPKVPEDDKACLYKCLSEKLGFTNEKGDLVKAGFVEDNDEFPALNDIIQNCESENNQPDLCLKVYRRVYCVSSKILPEDMKE